MNKLTDEQLIDELRIRMKENTDALEELKILNKKLEESEALKSHFISNITNEIVNPFASILGLSKNILCVKKENWKKVFSMVAMIQSEAFSLDFQLKNVFAAAKIEAGEVYPEIGKVDVLNLAKCVIDSFRIQAAKKRVSFDLINDQKKGDITVFIFKTDPEKLKLILSNLINNAVKFSFEDTRITVRVWIEKQELFISVFDYGVEISGEYQQLIFDRFKRIDTSITSINRGHGLGLSIIKSLVDVLGGDIIFESDPEKGTTFTINIPEVLEEEESFTTSVNGNEIFFEDNQIF